jgi:glutamate racemase
MAARILLFDSGVGALSLVPALDETLPPASLLYASDNAAYPYGTLDAETLVARVGHVLEHLAETFEPDLLIVACNTASTVALPRLRARLELPVVGVVPAIKPAAALTESGVIALLATPATVRRPYTQELITRFASHCEVLSLGSSELVALAEDKLRGRTVSSEEVRGALAPLLDDPRFGAADTIVLGCTHFPLLRAELEAAVPGRRQWVDSGEAIARRAAELLAQRRVDPAPPKPPPAVFTRDGDDVLALAPALRELGFVETLTVDLPFRRTRAQKERS